MTQTKSAEGPKGKVYIIGGGPGDPELLTLKAKRIIESADVIVYADSLVHPAILDFARPEAQIHGSKTLTLEEITTVILEAVREGKVVARIQSGDPSIYGAVVEQLRIFEGEGVDYEIIPGVSSAFAAAAVLKAELTVPEVSQTIIFTRAEGRVKMPAGEDLRDLAAHRCTLVIFLSISRITRVVKELLAGGYPEDTPVAVVYRVGWPDEKVIRGTLADIAAKAREARITLQAMIMVGQAINPDLRLPGGAEGQALASSHLYSSAYTHLYRTSEQRSNPARNGDDD